MNEQKRLCNEIEQSVKEDMLTVQEVAARLRLKRSWVYSNADRLGAYRLGKYLRFSWRRVLERLEQHAVRPAETEINPPSQLNGMRRFVAER